ncbi:MAG: GH3 auxin-responsive promoter family protein, partial [Alloprevotella sp.]|nr:GH3 auxin-responsive promoter family protein [Alloprevotella sp.]
MSLTRLARPFFLRRIDAIERYAEAAEEIQRGVLKKLLNQAANTAYGHQYAFDSIKSYEAFAKQCPLNSYEELKDYIDQMRHGQSNILWPGRVRWYAKSSGTTNDKSKFIPVTPQSLKDTHYQGGADAVSLYLHNHPQSRLFDGRALILGGSHQPNYNLPHSLVGDLSSILIENINPVVNLLRVPSKRTALLSDFEEKRDRIAREALNKNVTNISGVPSWMLIVLHRVLEISGKSNIAEVWPNLEVFFHGGIAFTPYRKLYTELIPSSRMHYMETYNASEGFFGLQSLPTDPAMKLMIDYGVFYEFIPLED